MLSLKLDDLIDAGNLDKVTDFYELINEKRLSAKETGLSYRTINHWDSLKIIRFGRSTKGSNRKFSFVDYVWLQTVNELRNLGVSLPIIKDIARELFEPIPIKEIFDNFSRHQKSIEHLLEGPDKEHFRNLIQSGEYKTTGFSEINQNFNILQTLVIEAIATRHSVSLIIFSNGEWFPYIKDLERKYPLELRSKKEYQSQIRVNLTEIIYRHILKEYMTDYAQSFNVFSPKESLLFSYVKKGNYKNIHVLFKSSKRTAITIIKSKMAMEQVLNLVREKEYREFIITDKKNQVFRIKDPVTSREDLELKEREAIFKEMESITTKRAPVNTKSKRN